MYVCVCMYSVYVYVYIIIYIYICTSGVYNISMCICRHIVYGDQCITTCK